MSFMIQIPTSGKILSEEAYAQGKMLDNSEWGDVLPRGITPSDVDLVFDNKRHLLVCEVSRITNRWEEIATGQREMYSSIVLRDRAMAAIVKHSIPVDRQIKTASDIESFSVMFKTQYGGISFTETFPGTGWVGFVKKFYRDFCGLRKELEESSERFHNQ